MSSGKCSKLAWSIKKVEKRFIVTQKQNAKPNIVKILYISKIDLGYSKFIKEKLYIMQWAGTANKKFKQFFFKKNIFITFYFFFIVTQKQKSLTMVLYINLEKSYIAKNIN